MARRRKKKRIITLIAVLAAALLICAGYFRLRKTRQEQERAKIEQMISSAAVTRRDIRTTVVGNGTLKEQEAEEVRMPKGVRVREILVEDGDIVSAGQVLATVDHNSVRNAIAATQSQIDQIDSRLLEMAEEGKEEELKAPVSGVITAVSASSGEMVSDVMAQDGSLMLLESEEDGRLIRISALSGQVGEIRVSEGSKVNQGDVLMVLDGVRDELGRGQMLTQREDLSRVLDTLYALSLTDEVQATEPGVIRGIYIKEDEIVTAAAATGSQTGNSLSALLSGSSSDLTSGFMYGTGLMSAEGTGPENEEGGFALLGGAPVSGGGITYLSDSGEEEFTDIPARSDEAILSAAAEEASAVVGSGEEILDAAEEEIVGEDVLPEEPAAQDPAWYGTDDPDDEYYAEEAEEAEEETWYGYGEPSGFDDAANLTGEGPAPDAGGVVSENNVEEGVEITDDSADTGLPQNITLPDGTTVEIPQDFKLPDGTTVEIPQDFKLPDGTTVEIPQNFKLPDGTAVEIPEEFTLPGGSSDVPETVVLPDGSAVSIEDLFGSAGSGEPGGMIREGSVANGTDIGSALAGSGLPSLTGSGLSALLGSGADLSSLLGSGMDLSSLLGSGVDLSSLSESELAALTGGNLSAAYTSTSPYAETAAFAVRTEESMNVSIAINELDILSVQAGQTAEISLDAIEGETFEGTVKEVAATGSNTGGSTKYNVTIDIPRDSRMREDMSCTVSILISEAEDIPVIPSAAIFTEQGKNYVYTEKAEDGTLGGKTEIGTGIADGEYVEIKSGLSEEQTVYYRNKSLNFFDMSMGMNGQFSQYGTDEEEAS